MDYHRAHLNNTNVPNNNNNTGEIKDGNVNPGQVETHHERRR